MRISPKAGFIILVLVVVTAVIYFSWANLRSKPQESVIPAPQTQAAAGLASSTASLVPQPKTANQMRDEIWSMMMEKPRGISSPDGKSILSEQSTTTYKNGCDWFEHELTVKDAAGKSRTLVKAVEHLNNTGGCTYPAASREWISEWQAIGWSADGKRAYYSRSLYVSPGGDSEPKLRDLGQELHEVDVATAKDTLLFGNLKIPAASTTIMEVLPARNLMVRHESDTFPGRQGERNRLLVSDLKGGNSKAIYYLDSKQGLDVVSDVRLSPDGRYVAVETAEMQSKESGADYRYTLDVVDLNTGVVVGLPMPEDKPWLMAYWAEGPQIVFWEYAGTARVNPDSMDVKEELSKQSDLFYIQALKVRRPKCEKCVSEIWSAVVRPALLFGARGDAAARAALRDKKCGETDYKRGVCLSEPFYVRKAAVTRILDLAAGAEITTYGNGDVEHPSLAEFKKNYIDSAAKEGMSIDWKNTPFRIRQDASGPWQIEEFRLP